MRIKIVANMNWPSFRNVALQVCRVLGNYCDCAIYDETDVRPGGNILFIGTVLNQTFDFLSKFLGQSTIVFYGTTEGYSFVDEVNLKVAKEIKIVAISNFVKQMLEEIGVPVAGVVHHGLVMEDRKVDTRFYRVLKNKVKNKKVIFTASANHSRKGLDNLLCGYHLVEEEIKNTYLILHSEPTGYYSISKIAKDLELKHVWLTELYGKLSSNQMNALYKLCSVYVQPSYSEGFGLPILEAFRFNKPVIAVDAPPFNEVIEHGRNGILVPSSRITWSNFANLVLFKMHMYRSEDLAHAMLELVTNQQRVVKMQKNIQKEKHNWSVEKLYPELLNYFT
jgi:glycosyltransferase involved in cell wall biosynthesis